MDMSRQETFCQFLKEQGFPIADLYDHGQVLFRCEGNHYLAQFHPDYPERFALALPGFWDLDDAEEEARALRAANQVNLRSFGTTVVCVNQTVTAVAELYLANPAEDLQKVFNSALKGVQRAAHAFVGFMRQSDSLGPYSANGTGTQHTSGYL
jgi:hypothetical protein